MASETKVIIAGAGIAGPILAIFLKLKGYDPIVYERVEALDDAGLSLCLQPNGLRVLTLIPGIMEKLVGQPLEKMQHISILPDENTVLADVDVSGLPQVSGYRLIGLCRPVLNRAIVEVAQSHGVKIVFGHQLVTLKQEADSVEVTFANGKTDSASFVIGCDGLHSNTRVCLFGEETASFTGLTQTGGVSPTPDILKAHPTMINLYADGVHMISYPLNDKESVWAITCREPEAKESWRSIDEGAQNRFKEGPWSQWPFGAGELVKSSTRVIKYGLYDRPALTSWHKGRVALLGDAAHPTSPHLGQGANQAFEDIYHLVRLLKKHNPSAAPPSNELLETIFSEYEQLRIKRTSEVVLGARRHGEARVVQGIEACHMRDAAIKEIFTSEASLRAQMNLFSHPFDGESEI
ncbi:FAD/NAD(P)-binding domain-containing protein [Daedalea quercina L-15889]|uniref:FAD/NAD(P)-binding domain-containing protein n=1 Tax=Daedalea quercina L-15889 TaxID=1314783 RepID=A0A165RL17_9APHY|nr:FAD/NAD(P)-binding domain-containing protein [Daedalea quercina L-15889]